MSKRVTLEGIQYPTLSAACNRYNVLNSTVTTRLQEGCTPEQAFGLVSIPPSKHKVFGREFKSYRAIAQFYDLPYSTLIRYARDCKTLEEAITRTQIVARRKRYNQVIIKGVTYLSLAEAVTALGIPLPNVYAHMRKGLTPEEAVKQVLRR